MRKISTVTYGALLKEIDSILKAAEFIPPSMKISTLLKLLQQNKLHMAVIVDEFGGTEGIVTLEDVIEELVGEIWDEHDAIAAESFHKSGEDTYRVFCSTDLDDLLISSTSPAKRRPPPSTAGSSKIWTGSLSRATLSI